MHSTPARTEPGTWVRRGTAAPGVPAPDAEDGGAEDSGVEDSGVEDSGVEDSGARDTDATPRHVRRATVLPRAGRPGPRRCATICPPDEGVMAMRACMMRQGRLVVDDTEDPRPEAGQMLVRILACGICGSDLHFLRHGETMVSMTDEMLPSMGGMGMGIAPIDLSRDIVMGHEFCAEVVELGPDTTGPEPGARVVSIPVLFSSTGMHQLAYNNDYPGGYAQYMVLSAPIALEVPNGLDSRHAAL